MTAGLKVGEVCIGQNFIISTEANGMECVIIGPLVLCECLVEPIGRWVLDYRHLVRWSDGAIDNVPARNLRRKQPPAGEESILRMFDLTAPAQREVEAA